MEISSQEKNPLVGLIEKRMVDLNWKASNLAKKAGVAQSVLSRFFEANDKANIGVSNIYLILKALDLLNVHQKEIDAPPLIIQTVPKMHTFHRDFAAGKFITVRLLHDHIAAGAPAHINENDVDGYCIIYSSKDWTEHDPENYTCVKVTGRSMYPILDSGDIVTIDHSERDPMSLDKKMVAFRKDGGVTIKWLVVKEAGEIILGMPEIKKNMTQW